MGEKFPQISESKNQTEECSQWKESQGHHSGGCSWGESQSGHQRPRENVDLEMVGVGEGLKTGG